MQVAQAPLERPRRATAASGSLTNPPPKTGGRTGPKGSESSDAFSKVHAIVGDGARAGLICGLAVLAVASPSRAADAARTSAAVIAATDVWEQAEINGVAEYVEGLLLPGYRTIGAGGKQTDRDAFVASVWKRRGRSETLAAQIAEWNTAHPSEKSVSFQSEAAIMTWRLTPPSAEVKVYSTAMFVYTAGMVTAVPLVSSGWRRC